MVMYTQVSTHIRCKSVATAASAGCGRSGATSLLPKGPDEMDNIPLSPGLRLNGWTMEQREDITVTVDNSH